MEGLIIKDNAEKIEGYQQIEGCEIYVNTIVFKSVFEEFFSIHKIAGVYAFEYDEETEITTGHQAGHVFLKIFLLTLNETENKIVDFSEFRLTEKKLYGISEDKKIIIESSPAKYPNYYYKHENNWLYVGNCPGAEMDWYYLC